MQFLPQHCNDGDFKFKKPSTWNEIISETEKMIKINDGNILLIDVIYELVILFDISMYN